MSDPLYCVSVRDCRAVVCARVDIGETSWAYVPADNWEELESDAIAWIEALGAAVNMSGLYPCPVELAERARFSKTE